MKSWGSLSTGGDLPAPRIEPLDPKQVRRALVRLIGRALESGEQVNAEVVRSLIDMLSGEPQSESAASNVPC